MNQGNERTTSMSKTKGLVQMAIFAALIVVLAFTPFIGYIPLGFTRATIIHIPVIMGSLMLGPKKGAALGGVFGFTSFINNTINPTLTSFVFTPFYSLGEYSGGIGSLIICFVPRILIGVVPFYVYRLVKKLSKNNGVSSVGLIAAGLSGALTNTLLVMNLIFVFFRNDYAAANGITVKAVYGFILSIIGINGIPEAIVAAVITLVLGKTLMKKGVQERLGVYKMILAIDIGNTNIVLGCVDDNKTYFIERLSTIKTKMELEYAIDIKMVLDIHGIKTEKLEGAIISSVVPQITYVVKEAAEKILKKETLVIGPGVKNGLNILMDNPAQLGSDLVANAVAGIAEYKAPMMIFDLGTATTVSVIDEKKNYIGGMIYPGVNISLNALTENASQLQGIGLEAPKRIVGKNTIECMKSGVLYSSAAAIDGIIDRIEEAIGQPMTAIATGGLSKKIVPYCKREVILDDDLLLKGLLIIYRKNR